MTPLKSSGLECFSLVEQIRKINRVSPTNPTKEEHPVKKALTTQKVVEKPQDPETQRKKPDAVTRELELDINEKPTVSSNITEGESCLDVFKMQENLKNLNTNVGEHSMTS